MFRRFTVIFAVLFAATARATTVPMNATDQTITAGVTTCYNFAGAPAAVTQDSSGNSYKCVAGLWEYYTLGVNDLLTRCSGPTDCGLTMTDNSSEPDAPGSGTFVFTKGGKLYKKSASDPTSVKILDTTAGSPGDFHFDATGEGIIDTVSNATWGDNDYTPANTHFVWEQGPRYKIVTSEQTNATASYTVVDPLYLALETNKTYEVLVVLATSSSEATNGNTYELTFSGGGTISSLLIVAYGTLASGTQQTGALSALATPSPSFCKITTPDCILTIQGTVTTNASSGEGVLYVQHAHPTSGTSTVRVGSYLKVTRLK